MSAPGRSILLVAYFYPPCRDTGAQRPAAMAKYLRRLGHRVTVLTTSAYGAGSPDEAEVERASDLQLLRARLQGHDRIDALFDADTYSGRPHLLSRFVVPEPLRIAWAPFALRRGLRLHRRLHFDCVITSSPPESAHLVGRGLHRRGVPWVVDLRDGWTFEPLRPPFATGLQRRLDERLERRWLGEADAVVCVSEPAAADLRGRGIADPLLIPNGWDPEAVPSDAQESDLGDMLDPDRVSLVYTGRFGTYGRDPAPLLRALARLARDDPQVGGRLELVIAGPLTEQERDLVRRDVSPARIRVLGSLERDQALALQRRADALLLLAQPTRSQLANFKLFEYLAAGRPILALAAGTEAGRIAAEAGYHTVAADDETAIAAALARVVGGELATARRGSRDAYIYPVPATRMAEAVELAIERRRG